MRHFKVIDIFRVTREYYLDAESREEAAQLAPNTSPDYLDEYSEYEESQVLEEVDEEGEPLLSSSSSPEAEG